MGFLTAPAPGAQRQLMLLLAHSGQRMVALSHYETFSALLEAELGVEPDPETEKIYQQLLNAIETPTHRYLVNLSTAAS